MNTTVSGSSCRDDEALSWKKKNSLSKDLRSITEWEKKKIKIVHSVLNLCVVVRMVVVWLLSPMRLSTFCISPQACRRLLGNSIRLHHCSFSLAAPPLAVDPHLKPFVDETLKHTINTSWRGQRCHLFMDKTCIKFFMFLLLASQIKWWHVDFLFCNILLSTYHNLSWELDSKSKMRTWSHL